MFRTEFVGRSGELEHLRSCWESARAGTPQIALIEGAAGIGKTALVSALLHSLPEAGQSLAVSGDESEVDLTFGLIEQLIGAGDEERDHSARATPWADAFEAGAELLKLLGRRQTRLPLVLAVDDIQLVDHQSLVALTFALRRLRFDRVLTVLTVRTEALMTIPPGIDRLVRDHGRRLRLTGLSAADVARLASSLGCGRLSRRAAERLREHTGGNPLHLRALMRELSAVDLRSEGALPAPQSFALLVLGTLAGLSAQARDLACAAAVLPDGVPVHDLALIAQLDDPLPDLENLQASGIAQVRGNGTAAEVEFLHPLIRAAVRDNIGPATRARLHQRAATVLGGPAALGHLIAAATGPDPVLAAAVQRRAQESQTAGHWHAAARLLLEAARLTVAHEGADALALGAADSLLIAGDVAAAAAMSERIAAMPPTTYRLLVQARMAWLLGHIDVADTLALSVWDKADDLDPAARDGVAAMLAQSYLMRDKGPAAAEWAARALESGLLPPDQAALTRGARALGLGMSGRPKEGLAELSGLPDDPSQLPVERRDELRPRGTLKLWTDDLEGARRDLAAATGAPHYALTPYCIAGMAYLTETLYRLGEWDEAVAVNDQATSIVDDMAQTWIAGFTHSMGVLVPACRGDWAEAQHHADSAWRIAQQQAGLELATHHYAANAAIHLAACRQDWPAVIAVSTELRPHATSGASLEPGILAWPVHYAEALLRVSRFDDARAFLDELDDVARQRQRHSRVAGVARVRAELALAQHDLRAARTAYETAIACSSHVDALEHARALASYGRFLRRRGERKSAIDRLQEARNNFVRLGSRPLIAQCDVELSACGIATTTPPPGKSQSLTPQERAVARLVCAGQTNKEVAETLVLSEKTISYHLGHVYSKLGVHSRSQLVTVFGHDGRQ